MSKLKGFTAVAVAVAAIASPLRAQERVAVPREPANLGIQASWADDADFGVGLRYENDVYKIMASAPRQLHFIFSFDYFFPDGGIDYYEGNVNLSYQIGDPRASIGPYVGGGLNIARAEFGGASNTEIGLNLLGGIRFRSANKMVPFLEARFELGGGEQLVLTGGLLFF